MREFGRVAERLAKAVHCVVESVIKVNKDLAGPEPFLDLFPRNDFAVPAREELEHPERLRRQLDDVAAPAQLAGSRIELEHVEIRIGAS